MSERKTRRGETGLCENFCSYYKPGKNEDLACQGYIVVHGIIRRGKRLSFKRPARGAEPDARTIAGLKERLCSVCPFEAGECDFILTGGTALPCGGFALLCHLLGTGEITLEEIDQRAGSRKDGAT